MMIGIALSGKSSASMAENIDTSRAIIRMGTVSSVNKEAESGTQRPYVLMPAVFISYRIGRKLMLKRRNYVAINERQRKP